MKMIRGGGEDKREEMSDKPISNFQFRSALTKLVMREPTKPTKRPTRMT
jgi:hypothetical protein